MIKNIPKNAHFREIWLILVQKCAIFGITAEHVFTFLHIFAHRVSTAHFCQKTYGKNVKVI